MFKLLYNFIVLLCISSLHASTIAHFVDSSVSGKQLENEVSRVPLLPQNAALLIPKEVWAITEAYLKGSPVDLSKIIGPENCQDYLNAAKYLDLHNSRKSQRSSYDIRLACLLNSNREIKTLEAFTTEPNSQFFQEVDAHGNYLPEKKLELYQAGQFELDFVSESQIIQKAIVDFAFKNMLQLSQDLNFNDPTLLLFVGTYGAGKSYQTKHHPWMSSDISRENDEGILSTDRLKRLYMQLVPGATNGQVHHETVALRKQIMATYLKTYLTHSLVVETVLNSQSEVESLLRLASVNTKIKIVDLDVDLETAILRILSREVANGDPLPDFKAIASAQKLVRETRHALIEKFKTNPNILSYELHYFENGVLHLVAKKENGIFRVFPGEEVRFQKTLNAEGKDRVEHLAQRLITLQDCNNYGSRLEKVLGMTFIEALKFLNQDIK